LHQKIHSKNGPFCFPQFRGQGFTGHYASVYRAAKQLIAMGQLGLGVVLFARPITLVRTDAGYFTTPVRTFIRVTWQASFMIDYNLRRQTIPGYFVPFEPMAFS
jgi:hypothetical protein